MMAAGVSSSRPAQLQHSLPRNTNINTNTTLTSSSSPSPTTSSSSGSDLTKTTVLPPPPLSSTASSSTSSSQPSTPGSASLSDPDPDHSPSPSAASASTLSLPSSSSNPVTQQDRLRHHLSSPNSTSNLSLASAPSLPPHPSLEPVAEQLDTPLRPRPASLVTQSRFKSSLSSPQQQQQRSGGFFAFAASAFDRTQTVISTFSDQTIRHKRSLSRLSISAEVATPSRGADPPSDKTVRQRPNSVLSSAPSTNPSGALQQASKIAATTTTTPAPAQEVPYSQPYSKTDASQPPPVLVPRADNKMHQTSSRLLRMTDDDRPFTKDFKDLFATLIVSLLPLSAHRVRLTKVEHTFLSEDAINNLGSLKFSQSNRMPDPKDPSRIVTTTTTTTFSMAKDMARSICQRFLEARLIESADGKLQQVYTMKGSVWQLTPKGIAILDQFCSKNGIQQKQVAELIGPALTQLVSLERDSSTDKLQTDRATMEVVFRRFAGLKGFNIKNNVNAADSESLSDYSDGLTGVKMAAERKIGGKTFKETFTGKAATDWLMDCSTTVDRRETVEICSYFVEYGLMESCQHDRTYITQYPGSHLFQPTKHAIYQITPLGKDLINGMASRGRTSDADSATRDHKASEKLPRDSNTQRLEKILSDPALRLLFRENLRETHCEENLSFYLDVDEFVKQCKSAIRNAQKNLSTTSMDGIKEIMAQAYGIYNAFLAPGSPCELNIDHQLRSNLATRMTKAVGQDGAMIETLHEVTSLFEDAQNAVFKLMASDSVPKFLRTPKYESVLKNYDFDAVTYPAGKSLDRSQSRSNRK